MKKEVVYHPEKGSEEDRRASLTNEYSIVWERYEIGEGDDWYFLELDITK